MYRAGVLTDGIIRIGVVRRLLPIMKLALNLTDRGQLAAHSALQNLLYDLYLDNSREISSGPDRLARLLEKLSADSEQWWTVTEMAAYCHLSENQFRRRFREKTGMSPKHYYDSLKMQIAAGKLLGQGYTLERIARELGLPGRLSSEQSIQADPRDIPGRVPGEVPYVAGHKKSPCRL